MIFYTCGINRMLDENFFFPSRMHISKRHLKGMFTKVKCNMIQFRYCDLNKIVDWRYDLNFKKIKKSVTEMPVIGIGICMLKLMTIFLISEVKALVHMPSGHLNLRESQKCPIILDISIQDVIEHLERYLPLGASLVAQW